MAHLSLSLLGPFQVTLDGLPVTDFESNKVRALLAYLAVEANRPHRREVLAGLLWGDWPHREALSNLRYALSNLRRVIGDRARATGRDSEPPFLLITRDTLQCNTASDYWLDVAAFTDLTKPALRVPSGAEASLAKGLDDVSSLEKAVALHRGSFLEGFSVRDSPAFEEWALLTRERLARQMSSALHRLSAAYERRGEYEQAQSYAWRLLELEPWDEVAHQQLMRALALGGQRSAALAQYEKLCRSLQEELGAEPSAETRALREIILSGELAPEPALRTSAPVPIWNLPASSTPFFGRVEELATLETKLAEPATRLVTLTGLGGSGKTRLAVEVGCRLAERDRQALATQAPLNFAHGIAFVPLAGLDSVEGLVSALADALRLRLEGGREQLLGLFRRKQLLLILDNLERLLAGVGFLAEIVRVAPGVKIMATSRERLQVQGEHVLPLGGLHYPEQDLKPSTPGTSDLDAYLAAYPALQLLVDGIRRLRSDFMPGAADLPALLDICRLVNGLPLALELAASWADVLSPDDILDEARRSLDFWQVDWPDLPQRQRSMRAVFDASWQRLKPAEKALFSSLSVFRGGFAREAAEQVVTGAETNHRLLAALVRKSLLQFDQGGDRYQIHELLRQFGAEKLAQEPDREAQARDRHSAYYAAALQKWGTDLEGPRQQAALSKMDADSENIRAAWQWAVEHGQVERLAGSIGGLTLFYWLLGRYEEGEAALRAVTRSMATRAVGLPTPSSDNLRLRLVAMVERSNFCRKLGRKDQVAQLHQQALALLESSEMEGLDTRSERARLLQSMGHFVLMSDYERGRQLQEQALVLFRELDEQWWMADALHDLGRAALFTCSVAEARRRFEESLDLFQSLGIPLGIAQSMAGLSMVARDEGRLSEAELYAHRAVSCFQEHCAPTDWTYGLDVLGEALEAAGEFDDALSSHEECLAIHLDLGQRHYSAYPRAALSRVNLHLGRYAEARAHAEIGLDIARETGLRFAEGDTHFVLGSLALMQGSHADAHAHLSESASIYAQLGDQGSLSRSHALLACTARGSGPSGWVREHVLESLHKAVESRSFLSFLWALPAIGLYLLDEGQAERALELYALAARYRFVSRSRWFEDAVGQQMAAVASTLPPDRLAAIKEGGEAQDLEATVANLLVELGD